MFQRLLFSTILFGFLNAIDLYEEDESTTDSLTIAYNDEPITNLSQFNIQALQHRNINCEDFFNYALNCTTDAALMYKSNRKAPPMPSRLLAWCRAIKYLAECAQDWNYDCRDVTDNRFNEESIQGHLHVKKNICDDENFLYKYAGLSDCIDTISDGWEICYTLFKAAVDKQKNLTREWTHYDTHFIMCCARGHFRRCTIDLFSKNLNKCSHQEVMTLQKFSVIVSEGDVFQDCDHNVMYDNCPRGDPRPSRTDLRQLLETNILTSSSKSPIKSWILFITLSGFFCYVQIHF